MNKYDEELKKLAAEFEQKEAELKRKSEKWNAQQYPSNLLNLAEELHELLCPYNHTDMCGWYYEIRDGIPNWEDNSHKKYLDMAKRVMDVATTEVAMKVIEAIKK